MKIAVITNSSLLWDPEVRKKLMKADWVSIKVDTVDLPVWRRINRPSRSLSLEKIQEGVKTFAAEFEGFIATETMLVSGINDENETLERTSDFVASLEPDTAYISIPTRPPALRTAIPTPEENVNLAFQVFSKKISQVELLTGYEGNLFAYTGNVSDDIISTVSAHPLRREAIDDTLAKANSGWEIIQPMIARKQIKEVDEPQVGEDLNLHKFVNHVVQGLEEKNLHHQYFVLVWSPSTISVVGEWVTEQGSEALPVYYTLHFSQFVSMLPELFIPLPQSIIHHVRGE